MTGKLLKVYAFYALAADRDPDMMQFEAYLFGTEQSAPLDFYAFPRLVGDLTVTKRQAIGGPMYGPSGMLVALVAMVAPSRVLEEYKEGSAEVPTKRRAAALRAAYEGESSA